MPANPSLEAVRTAVALVGCQLNGAPPEAAKELRGTMGPSGVAETILALELFVSTMTAKGCKPMPTGTAGATPMEVLPLAAVLQHAGRQVYELAGEDWRQYLVLLTLRLARDGDWGDA